MIPYLEDFSEYTTRAPLLFKGINQNEIIDDIEFTDGRNIDPINLPAISPRDPMQVIKRVEKPQSMGVCYNYLVYCADKKFYFNGIEKGEVSAGVKQFVDFNNKVLIFPDKLVYNYMEDTFEELEDAPDIDFATVHYNRVFGAKGSEVRGSKLGDETKWEDFSGTAMDSWAGDVYSHGNFTGLVYYQDHLVAFKRDIMYELYGYIPAQFKLQESAMVGCVDNRSIVEIGGVLYFVAENGVYAYQGGQPRPISNVLKETYISASAISDGRVYYVCVYNGKEYNTYAFDTWNNTWVPYDNLPVLDFVKVDETIYALTSDGRIVIFKDGTRKEREGDTLFISVLRELYPDDDGIEAYYEELVDNLRGKEEEGGTSDYSGYRYWTLEELLEVLPSITEAPYEDLVEDLEEWQGRRPNDLKFLDLIYWQDILDTEAIASEYPRLQPHNWLKTIKVEPAEDIKWEITTKNYDDGLFEKKSVRSLRLKCNMDPGASLSIYVNLDNKGFELKRVFTNYRSDKPKDLIFKLMLSRSSRYQIKIEGKGRSLVYGEREIIVGSDK